VFFIYVGTYVPSTSADATGAPEPMADASAYLANSQCPMPMVVADTHHYGIEFHKKLGVVQIRACIKEFFMNHNGKGDKALEVSKK